MFTSDKEVNLITPGHHRAKEVLDIYPLHDQLLDLIHTKWLVQAHTTKQRNEGHSYARTGTDH